MRQDTLLIALTFAAGAVDAIAFLELGVLTAVMTGNLVLLGVALGSGAAVRALGSLLALAAYAAGVIAAVRLAGRGPDSLASPRVARALAVEAVLLAAFFATWLAVSGDPEGLAVAALIALSGTAMGIQAATVQALGARISTTYVTGMLTTLIGDLSSLTGLGRGTALHLGAVLALGAGALAGALLLSVAPAAAPAVPLLVIAAVLVLARRAA